MNINLQMIADRLFSYHPKVYCQSGEMNITEVRISEDGTCPESHILYIGRSSLFFGNDSDCIVCKNQNDYLILDTPNLLEALNRTLEAFGFYARWDEKCTRLISNGCSLSDLLNLAEEILPRPMTVVDASQLRIACSDRFAHYRETEEWKEMVAHPGFQPEIIMQFNEKYIRTFEEKHLFYLPADYFPTSGWCHHIWVDGKRLATLIVVADGDTFSKGELLTINLIISHMQTWILTNHKDDIETESTSALARLLDGSPEAEKALSERLAKAGWKTNCPKQLFAASVISSYFYLEAMLSRLLSEHSAGIYSIPYQKHLVVLCNYDLLDPKRFRADFERFLQNNNYYAAYSLPFTDNIQIPDAYQQVIQTLTHSDPVAGKLYSVTQNAMHYITGIVKAASKLELTHPLVYEIANYDAFHKTDYFKTLFCYLKNERNHQITSAELFIHRNTLFKRLRRIEEIWSPALDNAEERFFLLYSFYQFYYDRQSPSIIPKTSPL